MVFESVAVSGVLVYGGDDHTISDDEWNTGPAAIPMPRQSQPTWGQGVRQPVRVARRAIEKWILSILFCT